MTRGQTRLALALSSGAVLVLILVWGIGQLGNQPGGKDPPDRLKAEPEWKDGEVSFFKTPHDGLYIGLTVPDGDEWSSGLVQESDTGRKGLPQFVRTKPSTAVAYLSVDRMDVPPEIEALSPKQRIASLTAAKREEWGKRIKDDLMTVASTDHPTEIKIDGTPSPGMTISVYVTKKNKDGKPQQYRVSETYTAFRGPREVQEKSLLIVTLRMEQEVEGDGIVTKMSDATKIEKDGLITFLPVPMGKSLDTARTSFCLATKRP